MDIIKKLYQVGKVLGFIVTFIIVISATLLCATIVWLFRTWRYLTMNELVYQLQTSAKGTNKDMIVEYIVECVPVTVLMLLVVVSVFYIFRKKKKVYFLIAAGFILAASISAGSFTAYAWNRLGVKDYMENKNATSDFIDQNYARPGEKQLNFPENKRNLIYIYLESVETTYADKKNGGAFSDNYIPELTKIAQENEDFSGPDQLLNGGVSLTNTTWTAAALFAQTSGLPLTVPLEETSSISEEKMLPGVVSLGDILDSQGYNQVFMIGSDGDFGGRKAYFTSHGNYDVEDYFYFQDTKKMPEDYWVFWGFEDSHLFDFAKERILELSQETEPFNFTMLTVDTHFEDGCVCGKCDTAYGNNQYANVISCSDRQVSEFVRWVQEQEFYENTTIVISGDHPTMDSDFCEDVDSDYSRKVYTSYINAAAETAMKDTRREYTTFDNFPTTLASLGVTIEGERLGLGTNLFSNMPTLLELYGKDMMNSELEKESELLKKLTTEGTDDNMPRQEEEIPSAQVQAGEYNYSTGVFTVRVSDFENMKKLGKLQVIHMAVWTTDDQSDLRWISCSQDENENYWADVYVPDFGYKTGTYYIEVYALNYSGKETFLGGTTCNVQ